MKKSRSITLTLMAGLAAACSDGAPRGELASGGTLGSLADSTRHCVDAQYRVVADSQCTRRGAGGIGYPYFFYFGGRTFASGGATYAAGGIRAPVGTVPTRGPVSRGGLGATGVGRTGTFGG